AAFSDASTRPCGFSPAARTRSARSSEARWVARSESRSHWWSPRSGCCCRFSGYCSLRYAVSLSCRPWIMLVRRRRQSRPPQRDEAAQRAAEAERLSQVRANQRPVWIELPAQQRPPRNRLDFIYAFLGGLHEQFIVRGDARQNWS